MNNEMLGAMHRQKETQIIPIGENGELVYTHWDQLTQISRQIMDAGITKLGNPAQINLIILKGKRLGLDIFEALENIAVINNKTSINGALASALVERSGKLVDKSHIYEGDIQSNSRKCSVTVQRANRSKVTWTFSLQEAKQAGLYPGKAGSGWSAYTDSMLYWRALGFCYRREFSDVLQGMYLTEELVDETPEIKIVTEAPPGIEADDQQAQAHPIIAEPSEPPIPAPQAEESKPDDPKSIRKLMSLALGNMVTHEELIEVINGLRLFPRGVEHKLEMLPEPKIQTLIKNWELVIRQIDRIRSQKQTA